MSSGTKLQEYTYNFRMANLAVYGPFFQAVFSRQARLMLEPPEELLEWKSVWTHFRIQMDPDATSKKIIQVGLADDFLEFASDPFLMDVDFAADGDGIVDVSMDLTRGLNALTRNFAEVIIVADNTYTPGTILHEVLMWKIDALYTTRRIQ